MKKINVLLSALTAAVLFAVLLMPSAFADGPAYSLHADKSEVVQGDTVSVTVRLNGADVYTNGIAALQADFSFNHEYLEKTEITVSPGLELLRDDDHQAAGAILSTVATSIKASVQAVTPAASLAIPSTITDVATFIFKVKEDTPAGTQLVFEFLPEQNTVAYFTGEDDLYEAVTPSHGDPVTVTVKEKEIPKSSDASLTELYVQGNSFTRSFLPERLEYTLTSELAHNVTSINISYAKSDEKANVIITGNTDIPVGNSTVEIKVTAEDGTVNTYKIFVTRKSAPVISSSTPTPSSSVSEPSSSDASSNTSSDTSSDPSASSDTGSDASGTTTSPGSSDVSGGSAFNTYDELQQTINQLKVEKQKILDRQFVIIIIFTALTVALLAALIVIAVNYKKDVK